MKKNSVWCKPNKSVSYEEYIWKSPREINLGFCLLRFVTQSIDLTVGEQTEKQTLTTL